MEGSFRREGTCVYLWIQGKIDGQWEFSVWLKKLKQGLCINLEGWSGEGDGREFQKGGDMCIPTDTGASLIAELVKNPPAM